MKKNRFLDSCLTFRESFRMRLQELLDTLLNRASLKPRRRRQSYCPILESLEVRLVPAPFADIELSNNTVAENAGENAVVGTLSGTSLNAIPFN